MKISAIIPTLGNRPDMLKEAVDSIVNQTVPAHEIIVVDYLDDTYGNQARRINKGVLQSTGDAYFFMGDDDILMPNFIERMISEFEETERMNQPMDIITSRFQTFGDESQVHTSNAFPLCSTIVKRSMYDKTKGYDEAIPIGIDADFYFQCFEANAQWKKIEDVLYRSRVHSDQYSNTGDWSQYHPLLKAKYNGKYSGY